MNQYTQLSNKQKAEIAAQLVSQIENTVLSNFSDITVVDTDYYSAYSRLLTHVEFSNKMIVWVTGESDISDISDADLYYDYSARCDAVAVDVPIESIFSVINDFEPVADKIIEGVQQCMNKQLKRSNRKRSKQTVDKFQQMQDKLASLSENVVNPLYEYPDDASVCYFENMSYEAEKDLGIWDEPSVQGGHGGVWIYDTDDNVVAESINYATFCDTLLNIYLTSKTASEVKQRCKSYFKQLIEEYAPNM